MYKKNVANSDLEELFTAIISLENQQEYKAFFEDLCTVEEIKAMAQRWHVARLLEEKSKYLDVQKLTGASSTTISRVKKCLEYGEGYALVFKKMKKEIDNN
ncbi:MAG: YerC/YecD family TrpR-related protein [Fusobacteria bacterium]|nr:YerC/YecD family TrpR-related protein [Fusobacteriota bacterium]